MSEGHSVSSAPERGAGCRIINPVAEKASELALCSSIEENVAKHARGKPSRTSDSYVGPRLESDSFAEDGSRFLEGFRGDIR